MRVALAALMLMVHTFGWARLSAQSTTRLAPLDSISIRTAAPYVVPLAFQQDARRSSGTGFVMEWLGGTVGSATSFGLGIALANCEDEAFNLDCAVTAALVTLAVSIPASTLGAYLFGQIVDSQPSAAGGVIGSVVGMVGGILVVNALDSESSDKDVALVLGYAATQGLFTAIGSRIGAALR